MKAKICFLTVALATMVNQTASASDFYIYPVGEIEGLYVGKKPADARPLVDQRAVELFPAEVQKKIVGAFSTALVGAYPNSIVHPSQVRELVKGSYKYFPTGTKCGEGFVAPVARTYGLVAGITRASYYEVDKGEVVDILVPVTLNVQVVKPERAKIIYTASSTQYTPFVFAKKELLDPSTKELMSKALTENTIKQLGELVAEVRANFSPQDMAVKLIAAAQGYWVADKGFSVGFKVGDELEATAVGVKSIDPLIFKVLSVDSKYSVLKVMDGAPTAGAEYKFTFSGAAEDGRKPKIMPVFSNAPDAAWSVGVADLFAKNIGFGSPFLLNPVDVNFSDTMESVKQQANCVTWDKYPNSKTIFDSRIDHSDFYLRFEMGRSPVFVQQGKGAVKTEESFSTVLATQVIDRSGNIIYAEIGKDNYVLERVGRQGLSLANAEEVSIKNAVVSLSNNFKQNIKLENKEYVISDVQPGEFFVKGLNVVEGQDITYEIYHPTGLKVNGEAVSIKLDTEPASKPPLAKGGGTEFSYINVSPDYPKVSNGDVFRVLISSKPSLPEISSCGGVYVGKDSLPGDFLTPLINNAAYHAVNYNVSISDPDFYEATNKLLYAGFFKFRMIKPQSTEYCFKPGYVVKMLDRVCNDGLCSGKVQTGIKVTVERKGGESKDYSIGESTAMKDFSEGPSSSVAGFRSMLSAINIAPELLKRINSK